MAGDWRELPESHAEVTLREGRSLLLRPMETSDAAGLAEMCRSLSNREKLFFPPPNALTVVRQANDPFRAGLVAVDAAGRVLGCAFFRVRGDDPWWIGLCIHAEAQNMGLGTALLRQVIRLARAMGAPAVGLSVHADNPRALHLYEREGFVKVGEFINEFGGLQHSMHLRF